MWITLAVVLIFFGFLCLHYAHLLGAPANVVVSNDDDDDGQEDHLPNLNRTKNSPGPQTPHRIWIYSDDDSDDQEDRLSNVTGSTNTPRPQTPYVHSEWSDDGSDDQEDHLSTLTRSTDTPVVQTPHRGYLSDGQEILFFKLDGLNMTSQGDIALSEIVPSSGEAVDLDSGTMLLTLLSDIENRSRTIEFHVSPLRGSQDIVLLYTVDRVLAVRIPTTRLEESRASISDTITRLMNLAESTLPSPKTISWPRTQCESLQRSQTPPIRVCLIVVNSHAAAIRGSRIPNGIPRNTYTILSGRFCSVRLAFDKYFELKREEMTKKGLMDCDQTGKFKGEKYNFNGERELLNNCPRRPRDVQGGIFVRHEDGVGWNRDVMLW